MVNQLIFPKETDEKNQRENEIMKEVVCDLRHSLLDEGSQLK